MVLLVMVVVGVGLLLGGYAATWWRIATDHVPAHVRHVRQVTLQTITAPSIRARSYNISRAPPVQATLSDLIHEVIQQYVRSWWDPLTYQEETVPLCAREALQHAVDSLQLALADFDAVTVTRERLLPFFTIVLKVRKMGKRTLHQSMLSPQTFHDFTRALSQALVLLLTEGAPSLRATLTKTLLTDLVQTLLLYSEREFGAPNYLNQCITAYFHGPSAPRKSYAYSENYARFVKRIQACTNVEELLDMRFHIIYEILQIQQEQHVEALLSDPGAAAEIPPHLQEPHGKSKPKKRSRQRYLNQCILAKSMCERRIIFLGGSYTSEDMAPGRSELGGTLHETADDGLRLSYFMEFLAKKHMTTHMQCWLAMQRLRKELSEERRVNPEMVFNVSAFILAAAGNLEYFQISSSLKQQFCDFFARRSEEQIRSDCEEGAFWLLRLQSAIYRLLVPEHHAFLTSPQYRVSVSHAARQAKPVQNDAESISRERYEAMSVKLRSLEGKLFADSIEGVFDSEAHEQLDMIRYQMQLLESYFLGADEYWNAIDQWRVELSTLSEGDDGEWMLELAVHRPSTEGASARNGWVAYKTLAEFRQIVQSFLTLGFFELPVALPAKHHRTPPSRADIQQILDAMQASEQLRECELWFAFLRGKNSDLAFSALNSSLDRSISDQHKANPADAAADTDPTVSPQEEDNLGSALLALLEEVFALQHMSKVFRRSLISFAKLAYGKSISRFAREGIEAQLQEEQMLPVLQMIQAMLQTSAAAASAIVSQTTSSSAVPTEHGKAENRPAHGDIETRGRSVSDVATSPPQQQQPTLNEVRAAVSAHPPRVLATVIGATTCRDGLLNLVDLAQDEVQNRAIIAMLAENIMVELLPGLEHRSIKLSYYFQALR